MAYPAGIATPTSPGLLRCPSEIVEHITMSGCLGTRDVLNLTLVCRRMYATCAWSLPLARHIAFDQGSMLRFLWHRRSSHFGARQRATLQRALRFEDAGARPGLKPSLPPGAVSRLRSWTEMDAVLAELRSRLVWSTVGAAVLGVEDLDLMRLILREVPRDAAVNWQSHLVQLFDSDFWSAPAAAPTAELVLLFLGKRGASLFAPVGPYTGLALVVGEEQVNHPVRYVDRRFDRSCRRGPLHQIMHSLSRSSAPGYPASLTEIMAGIRRVPSLAAALDTCVHVPLQLLSGTGARRTLQLVGPAELIILLLGVAAAYNSHRLPRQRLSVPGAHLLGLARVVLSARSLAAQVSVFALRGARLLARDEITPLLAAVRADCVPLARVILERLAADPERLRAAVNFAGFRGHTPLLRSRSVEMAQLLLAHGASDSHVSLDGSLLHVALLSVRAADGCAWSSGYEMFSTTAVPPPLHPWSAGRVLCWALGRPGPRQHVNLLNSFGVSPLFVAVALVGIDGRSRRGLVRALLDSGALPLRRCRLCFPDKTPIWVAAAVLDSLGACVRTGEVIHPLRLAVRRSIDHYCRTVGRRRALRSPCRSTCFDVAVQLHRAAGLNNRAALDILRTERAFRTASYDVASYEPHVRWAARRAAGALASAMKLS